MTWLPPDLNALNWHTKNGLSVSIMVTVNSLPSFDLIMYCNFQHLINLIYQPYMRKFILALLWKERNQRRIGSLPCDPGIVAIRISWCIKSLYEGYVANFAYSLLR